MKGVKETPTFYFENQQVSQPSENDKDTKEAKPATVADFDVSKKPFVSS